MPAVGQSLEQLDTETEPLPLASAKRTALLTLEEFQSHLGQLAKAAGSNAETGRRLGVTGQFIDMLIAGKRKPGKKLLAAIKGKPRLMIEIEVEAE